jgi:hypothetical protein
MKNGKTNLQSPDPGSDFKLGERGASRLWRKTKALLLLWIFPVFLLPGLPSAAQTLTGVVANSGSMAPWGLNQGLRIDAAGNATINQQDVETGVIVYASVVLTPGQMQAIADTALAAGFFTLNPLYDSGALDGSGVWLKVTTTSASHASEVRNICVRAMNRVVKTINTQIAASGIQLQYGYLNDVCP